MWPFVAGGGGGGDVRGGGGGGVHLKTYYLSTIVKKQLI